MKGEDGWNKPNEQSEWSVYLFIHSDFWAESLSFRSRRRCRRQPLFSTLKIGLLRSFPLFSISCRFLPVFLSCAKFQSKIFSRKQTSHFIKQNIWDFVKKILNFSEQNRKIRNKWPILLMLLLVWKKKWMTYQISRLSYKMLQKID